MRELVKDNALIFPPGNESSLTNCILKLAEDDELYEKLRNMSRNSADGFDGRNIAQMFEKEYQNLLNQKSGL